MEITTLSGLLRDGLAEEISNGIVVEVRPSLIMEGEDRLSYTSIIRLIECAREHHWQHEVLQIASGQGVDSICKSLSADFKRPVLVGSRIAITYSITAVRKKSYYIRFQVTAEDKEQQYAVIDMLCVFYNPLTRKATSPPLSVMGHLTERQGSTGLL